ncbi:hypothetical protein ASF63_14065 [Microbacterium sp. Leaf320]|nr:GDSL-type esterase/lipase family protein [Microbacterium sp. Leaf320]KQQ65089.1 hypothetical protein ASF63_14065 [Microbacterium sp. Leaf320]
MESFLAQLGWTGHNYSIGGGSFTGWGPGTFQNQLANAIADTSYDHADVDYFLVCDLGNDIRATSNIHNHAKTMFEMVAAEYPRARIIVLPAVWGNAPGNNSGGCIQSIAQRVEEITNAAFGFDVDIVPETWLWLADAGGWMKPNEVHPNAAGYARIADFMVKHVRGLHVSTDQPLRLIAPRGGVNGDSSYWYAGRSGDLTSIHGVFELRNNVGVDTELGQLDYGMWPISTPYIPVVSPASRQVAGTLVVFGNGLIRTLSGLPAGAYNISHTWRSF